MKLSLWFYSVALVSGMANAAEAPIDVPPGADPTEITAPVDRIFIPDGFDDNDNVEVVIHGNFPDTCHTVGRTSAKVDIENRRVSVIANSYRYPGKLCLQTITPFIQSISLGLVPSGEYQVVYEADQNVSRSLAVSKRKTESADDYLYASVENANLEINPETGKQVLQISGHFPHFFVGCMVISDVRTQLAPADVLVVQPVAEIVNDERCAAQASDMSFSTTVGLKDAFRGEGLLHVRTLNGNSINRYLNIN